jgi:hypothetical protein
MIYLRVVAYRGLRVDLRGERRLLRRLLLPRRHVGVPAFAFV